MAYLNWKASKIKPIRATHPIYHTQLEIELSAEQTRELASDLQKAFPTGGQPSEELKLELPENWTLYWKAKSGLSRLQLAHPQTNHWVATIHLTTEMGTALLAALAQLHANALVVAISGLGTLAPINNFELVLRAARS